jgi:hypothetical protein
MTALQIKAMTQTVEFGSRALEGVREFLVFGGEQVAPQALFQGPTSTAGDATQGSDILEPPLRRRDRRRLLRSLCL